MSTVRSITQAGFAFALFCSASAYAQSAPSDFTSAVRYDSDGRVLGTIAPDPDGAGPLHYAANRTTYDAAGRATRVEKGELASWQPETTAPADWFGYTVFSQVDMTYDGMDRKVTEKLSAGGVAYSLTQYSYGPRGLLECAAVRMNPAIYASLPSSACTLGTEGSNGPDRITRNVYDAVGQVLKVQKAYGTSLQQDYVTYTYSADGKPLTVQDANGNLASYGYDGFDRLVKWSFPDKGTTGAISATDYEAYGYDANGNRTSLRKRDGQVIGYTYDALNRVTVKDIPGGTSADVYYGYDLRGLQLYARFGSASGAGIASAYDGFGQLASTTSDMGASALTLSYQYDADGNRTRLTWPDGVYVTYSYDGLDRMVHGEWYKATTGTVPFLTIPYDAQGRRVRTTRGSSETLYSYDAVSRLASETQSFSSGTANTVSTYSYNPASQLTGQTRSNDAYSWTGYINVNRGYAANGLNQYTAAGTATFSYDANGNLTGDGTSTFGYDIENRLTSKSGGLAIAYDPNGRLWQTSGSASGTTRYLYDGDNLVAEYDGSGAMTARYVFGPGTDEPILADTGSAMDCTSTRFLHPDAQGSIVATANCGGAPVAINSYDEYGIPALGNTGRFQYTGQIWLPDLGMYYYKARMYSPTAGRFMQTDPIGYADQNNLYAYVANDPVNRTDPTGQRKCSGLIDCAESYVEAAGEAAAKGTRWLKVALGIGVAGDAIVAAQSANTIKNESERAVRMTVYRVYDGTKAGMNGRSWSLEDPRKMTNWRDRLAVYPAWNAGTKVVQGNITMLDMMQGRVEPSGQPGSVAGPQPRNDALGGGPYRGLGNELIIPNAATTVQDKVAMPMPRCTNGKECAQ